jgi:hypothetical protein
MPPWSAVVNRRYDRLAPRYDETSGCQATAHHRPAAELAPRNHRRVRRGRRPAQVTITDQRDVTVRDDAAPVARQNAEQPARPESALSSAPTTAALYLPDPARQGQ